MAKQYEYVANLHVHTTYSDGTGSMEEVIQAAQRAGLDALLINDHDTLAARGAGYEGYHQDLLVLVGTELSGPHNHYLVYGLEHSPEYSWRAPQEFINQIKGEGGIGFLAHPFETGSPLNEGGRAYTWDDWTVDGFDGICIWNYSSCWKSKVRNWPTAFYHYFLNYRTLDGPDRPTLGQWDQLAGKRRVAAVGGSDAHAFRATIPGGLAFTVFPYEQAFRAINTHVLLCQPLSGDLDRDRAELLGALKEGSSFVAHDRIRSSRGFDFWLENDGVRRAGSGQEIVGEKGDYLRWMAPKGASTRLIKDGLEIPVSRPASGRQQVLSPGAYRLEAYWPVRFFGLRPWIFSNHIYVRP